MVVMLMQLLSISIHAPPRGATRTENPPCCRLLFQFTPLREGRHPNINSFLATVRISIHAPPRGATRWRRNEVSARRISIHAPPRGATMPPKFVTNPVLFQFTPLREGRPSFSRYFRIARTISIHAPPRGATTRIGMKRAKSLHFNSRPSARGDRDAERAHTRNQQFQFTPLREGRRYGHRLHHRRGHISIHAPPRGATKHL